MKEYLAILRLVWPLALGMLNNAVLQFVDRAFLAKESMASIEAVLPASMLALIVTGFFQSIVSYSGTFVAQYHGAGDARGVAASYRAGKLLAVASGLLAAGLVPLGWEAFALMTENAEVLGRSRAYYTIVSLGSMAVCGQAAAAAFFTGRSRTRLVFWVCLAGNLINIALDPVLIFGLFGVPRLGIGGAAAATVFATLVQWAVLDGFARKDLRELDARPALGGRAAGSADAGDDDAHPFWPLVRRILRYGVPSGAYSVLNCLSFTVFVFVTGRVGDVAFAVSNACFSVNWLLIAPMEGFAIGAATLVGQAQGRGDGAAARAALRRTLVLALAAVTALSLAAVVFHRPILAMFAPTEAATAAEFHSLGFILIVLMAAWQIFDAADVVVAGALKGAGDTKFVMWWMVAAAFGFWLPLVFAVRAFHNTMPALWATMVAYVVVICMGELLRWRRGAWEKIKVIG